MAFTIELLVTIEYARNCLNFILSLMKFNNNTQLKMYISHIDVQAASLDQKNHLQVASSSTNCSMVLSDDIQTVSTQLIQDQDTQQNYIDYQFEIQLYSGPESKVGLRRKIPTGQVQVLKITEIPETNQSTSIHLGYQDQFYKKINETNVSYLLKTNHFIKNSSKCIRVMNFACRGNLTAYIPTLSFTSQQQREKHLRTVKIILLQIVKGLEEIHNLGYAYRDLKPSNVVIDHNGKVLLCDFALIGPIGAVDSSICGTLQYIAPQRLSKKRFQAPINPSLDFWALGVLTFQLLMGYTPFQYENNDIQSLLQSMFEGHLNLDSQYPFYCRHFIYNLLETNPSKRFNLKKIKQHQFFKGIQEEPLLQQRCKCAFNSRV